MLSLQDFKTQAMAYLPELVEELASYYDYEYQFRDQYPFIQKKYDAAMKQVEEIREFIRNNEKH